MESGESRQRVSKGRLCVDNGVRVEDLGFMPQGSELHVKGLGLRI